MALTPSNMLPLGTLAPAFELPDGNGELYQINAIKRCNGLMVVFMCNHCPYVIHLKAVLTEAGKKLQAMDVGVAGINSNDADNYADDAPDKMIQDVEKYGYTFPYLYDETQAVAKVYDAACTPDFYLFDKDLKLVYRGQFDASRPGNNEPVTGGDLYAAVEALVAGQPINTEQIPSVGCNIKWK